MLEIVRNITKHLKSSSFSSEKYFVQFDLTRTIVNYVILESSYLLSFVRILVNRRKGILSGWLAI